VKGGPGNHAPPFTLSIMIFRGPGVLGLLVLLGALTACTSEASTPPEVAGTPALAGYHAPPHAPGFCGLLAGSTHLRTIPAAVGTLAVDSSDAAARQELAAAVVDLRAVLDDVRYAVEYADLETAVEDLVDALTEASGGRLPAELSDTIARTLTAVADEAQPACEFPT
jgi:hypothetical protein